MRVVILALVTAVCAAAIPSAFASPNDISGQEVYERACAGCHLSNFGGSVHTPGLVGEDFMSRWRGLTAGDLLRRIAGTMPPAGMNPLQPAEYIAVTQYLLESNGIAAPGSGSPSEAELEGRTIN